MLVAVPQRQLIDEDGPQDEPTGVGQPFRRHLPMAVEVPFTCSLKFSIVQEQPAYNFPKLKTEAEVIATLKGISRTSCTRRNCRSRTQRLINGP